MKPVTQYFLLCSLSGLAPCLGFGQNVNSPYSVYGFGDLDNRHYDRSVGMAGTGLALPSSVYLANSNPAGLAGLQRSFYLMNIAGTGKLMHYTGDPTSANNSSNKDFWIKGISLSAKVNGFWASSIGFNQFSNVNYKFNGLKQIEGTVNSYVVGYQGDGGLNEYYWSNAVSLGKHFSLGLKSSLIAGSINQTESINDPTLADDIVSKQQDYYSHFRLQAGVQYYAALNKNWDLSLGGTYSPKSGLPADRTLTVTENTTTIVNDQYIASSQSSLPQSFGTGIALVHNKKTTYAADYTFQNWGALGIKGPGWQLINSSRLSAGIELSSLTRKRDQTFERRFFQAGAFIEHSYLDVRNHPINSYGASIGTGGNLNGLLYHIALEGGQRGTIQSGLIRESYLQLTLSFSYRDFLFSKGRKYN